MQGGSLHSRLYRPSRSSSGGAPLAALSREPSSGSASGGGGGTSSGGASGRVSAGGAGRRARYAAPVALTLREALVIAADVAGAMIYLHEPSEAKPVVVHRDLVRRVALGDILVTPGDAR